MPKKKIQHKGKTKQAVEQSENETYGRKLTENVEEEYTTVTDYETTKFNKRLVENNWRKYETISSDFDSDEEDESHKTGDFNFLLKTASSDCSHFQFSSEKQWKNEDNLVPPSAIFNLDLDLLSKGLGCLPFYERIGLNGSELSEKDRKSFDEAAAKSREDYNALCRNLKKSEGDLENKEERIDKGGGEENLVEAKSDNVEKLTESEVKRDENKQENEPKSTKKAFFSENEENLEDWLDSVLDD